MSLKEDLDPVYAHLRLAQIQTQANVMQAGRGSGGHCKYAIELAAIEDKHLPFHIHWVGPSENGQPYLCQPSDSIVISHLESETTPHRQHNVFLGMWQNPRLKATHLAAGTRSNDIFLSAALSAVARQLSPNATLSGNTTVATIHVCWQTKLGESGAASGPPNVFLTPSDHTVPCCSYLCKSP